MIEAWMIYVQVSCAEPRLHFKEFYLKRTGRVDPATLPPPPQNEIRAPRGTWLYSNAETLEMVVSRAMDSAADYMDYVVTYNEQCKVK